VLATLEAVIMQEAVSRGELADAVDAAFALVARISLGGWLSYARKAESHIKRLCRGFRAGHMAGLFPAY